jgi:Transposase DDE domain group 1
MRSSHSLDRLVVTFGDEHAVANAGLVLPATLAAHLGLEAAVDEVVDLGLVPGGAFPGRKVMTLVHAMVAGGDCIDDIDVLRAGSTQAVFEHRVMAPSTCGTFLRSFSFGHVRQLDRWSEAALGAAWAAGAGPDETPMTIDVDSTICEVHGDDKAGAAYGYTRVLGYHPMLATRADTGEVLHLRFRKGSANTGRGAQRFVRELVGRVRRAGASGPLTLRADSGFWSQHVIQACRDHQVTYSISVHANNRAIAAAISAIGDTDWVPIEYPEGGEAQVAETTYKDHRLVVRRTRLLGDQATLWPDWRHHAFITNRTGELIDIEADHRQHAVIELAIRDLKDNALAHCPSGQFWANSAWAILATVAHNLIRWTARLGLAIPGLVVTKTIRRRFLTMPGRLTRSARRDHLDLPARWPWADQFLIALHHLRAIPIRS